MKFFILSLIASLVFSHLASAAAIGHISRRHLGESQHLQGRDEAGSSPPPSVKSRASSVKEGGATPPTSRPSSQQGYQIPRHPLYTAKTGKAPKPYVWVKPKPGDTVNDRYSICVDKCPNRKAPDSRCMLNCDKQKMDDGAYMAKLHLKKMGHMITGGIFKKNS
ncbi:hypothetical protein C8J56DRAFT_972188 [Mycena floridula]|nr:hypothetical protein C8J56DRAFT_972188 [Mycena floridula]